SWPCTRRWRRPAAPTPRPWPKPAPSFTTPPSSSPPTAPGTSGCERPGRAVRAQPQRAAASGQPGLKPAGLGVGPAQGSPDRTARAVRGPCGRFAPSPSGRLHLGNLSCSLLAWLSARSRGGRIVLRIEDLDAARCPRVYADQLEEDLRWLGLDWDEGGSRGGAHGPYYQSECSEIYTKSYKKLEAMGLVYPCFCSRAQLHAASAPHTADGNVVYPGTCRGLTP